MISLSEKDLLHSSMKKISTSVFLYWTIQKKLISSMFVFNDMFSISRFIFCGCSYIQTFRYSLGQQSLSDNICKWAYDSAIPLGVLQAQKLWPI